ncbi:MAG TPA: preprotein translocase subunit TatC [Acidobacteria bacterium]|nr:preprotein translocase subunit TatC [Acidobacteriota bacterium]
MSFLDHLEELRKRLVISIAALFIGVLVAYTFVGTIFEFMMRPLVAGVFLASPALLSQLWLFVAPGLYAREKRYAIPFVAFSTLFFVAGGLFSHFIAFQALWAFFASLETELVTFTPRIAPMFSLYMRMLLAFGAVFQMPILAFFLARMGSSLRDCSFATSNTPSSSFLSWPPS